MDQIDHKHLNREQFQELLHILECYEPNHPLTMWARRAFCVNDGDSTLHVCSLQGIAVLQWTHDKFDEEDDEMYDMWYNNSNDDTEDWDFDE